MRLSCLFVLFLLVLAQTGLAEKRAAFVVGNSIYDHVAPLDNPARDAALVGDTLAGLGFVVERLENASRAELTGAFSDFLNRNADADVTLLYFAGHGLQFEGRNYLVGRDARLRSTFDIDAEAVQLDRLVSMMRAKSRAALVFIDACRDNPLADTFYRENFSDTRALMTRGLAPVQASDGAMHVFAASPGQVAYDGTDGNSPFAAALARHLPAANAEILSLMKRVIRDVKAETEGRQIPVVTNDLTADIFLNLSEDGAGAALALQQEEAMFEAALGVGTRRGWDLFLARHPGGSFADLARAERERLLVADLAVASGTEVVRDGRTEIAPDVARQVEADLGLTRDDSRAVQQALNQRGYDAGPVDGAIGRRTRVAVADFQLAVGLPSTGVVTGTTAEALGVALSRAEERAVAIVASKNARKYDPAQLALIEDDPRLIKAARALNGREFIFGYFEGRLYISVLSWNSVNFDYAIRMAEQAGGHLATVSDEKENEFIYDLVRHDDRMWRYTEKRLDKFGPALGMRQTTGAREPDGGFEWHTKEPVTYTNWLSTEPNNYDNNEGVLTFHYRPTGGGVIRDGATGPKWGDMPDIERAFVIEIE